MEVVDKELILANMQEVLEMEGSGLRFMLDNDKYEDLRLVYRLVSRVDAEKKGLKKMMCQRLVQCGKDISRAASGPAAAAAALASAPKPIAAPAPSDEVGESSVSGAAVASEDKAANSATLLAIRWVDEVLLLKDKYEAIWEKSFEKDKGIQASMTKAFTDFINDFARSPEYMSLFIDENLRKGLKGKTEAEVDVVLEKALTLFRYVGDKDVFERYYKKHLSRRLLMNRSVSHDAENQMIGKLKMEVGFAFTSKLEGMFKDMNVSEEMTSEYKKGGAVANKGGIDLAVSVLTSTFWPLNVMGGSTAHPCTYPSEIEGVRKSFEKYYLDRHSGRRLMWQANMVGLSLESSLQVSSPLHSLIWDRWL